MASNKKVITLGLDYSQFDGGITEVNRKMGLLDAEFKLAAEQTKKFGDVTDILTLKQEQLTQKIVLQTKKVDASKEAYDKALSSGKASEKQIDNLDKALLKERITLEKLNNELLDNNKKMEESTNKAESFGDSIRGMASALGLEVSPALEGVASKFDGLDKNVGNAILGIGAIITTLASCTFEAANFADELLEMSSVTGVATDELQKMKYASDFLDVELDTMTGSMTKLTRSMNSAREGTDAQEKAFQKLHLRYKESNGQLRDVNDVFYETIDALGRVKNETERDALAMTLMGKSAKDLNPLIEAGSKALKELGIEAENMGTVMSEDSLNKLGLMKDAMDKMENTSEALKNSLGLALLPILTALFTAISAIPVPVLQTVIVLATVVTSILLVVKAIKSVTGTASEIGKFFTTVNPATLKTTGIIMGVVAALIALAIAIAVITGKSNDLQNSMSSVGNTVGTLTNTVTNTQRSTVRSVGHANGTKYYQGGKTWVGEDGPELIEPPVGSRIYSNRDSKAMSSGGDNFYFNIVPTNIREITDLINIANNFRQTTRQGVRPIG